MKRILERIREMMKDYENENGPIPDDLYDTIFTRYYLKIEEEIKNGR